MKLGFGLYRHMLNEEHYKFAKQCGATHVVVHLVDYFATEKNIEENANQPIGEKEGWGSAGSGKLWSLEELLKIKKEIIPFCHHNKTYYFCSMPKTRIVEIKESYSELQQVLGSTVNYRLKLRIQSLILTKEEKFKDRKELAQFLGVSKGTLQRWTETYEESGLSGLLTISSGGDRKTIISESIHLKIKEKLEDSENPLRGYWDAVEWLKDHHQVEINYYTLRKYMIKHFHSKLKTPRKSHYKKDEQAIEAFKKTTGSSRVD